MYVQYCNYCVPASERCRVLDINKAGKLHPKREAWLHISRASIRTVLLRRKCDCDVPVRNRVGKRVQQQQCVRRDNRVSSVVVAVLLINQANTPDPESETRLKLVRPRSERQNESNGTKK